MKSPKKRTMATTTLVVTKPTDFSNLRESFRLIRYEVPDSFRYKKDKFRRLHVQLRAQLDVPYRHYFHDELDGAKKVVVYALYPREVKHIRPVTLDFVSSESLASREIDFSDISLFNLLKLLQANYFDQYPYFAGMGAYYIHALQTSDTWHVCMEVVLKGSNENIDRNKNELDIQEFHLLGHATNFKKVTKRPEQYQKLRYPYFKKHVRVSKRVVVFEQVPFNQLDDYSGDLFEIYRKSENPARLPYHKQNKSSIQPCRGYLLHQFQKQFIDELRNYGIEAESKKRDWIQYATNGSGNLPIDGLGQVCLFDNRQNTKKHPIGVYKALLEETYDGLVFQIIDAVSESNNQPVLILQDTAESDYQDGGVFAGQDDPYKSIYRDYVDTPKQTINVNENSKMAGQFNGDRSAYLNYPMIEFFDAEDNETDWAIQFQVCLYQLYLKDVVINHRPVSATLPIDGMLAELTNYVYVRKQTRHGRVSYHVMLKIKDDQLQFFDLRDPEQRIALFNAADEFGYDWDEIEATLKSAKHLKGDEELKRYDLVLMPGSVVQLESVPETVLYDYDEIEARLNARTQQRAIREFELAPHYEQITNDSFLSTVDLEELGLLAGREPFGDKEDRSLKFYQKLQSYDEMLADLEVSKSQMSLNELLELRNHEIGSIFDLPKYRSGKYNTRRILDYYKVLWNIGGFKADDVQISKGIWFDETDKAYRVADVNGFDVAQERAHTIRRFNVLVGEQSFDMRPFLEASAVKFVRFRQYTVYPYFFYLIDKYIDDVLRHQ